MKEIREIECAMREKRSHDGTPISGHEYRISEQHDDCHVDVMRCEKCGSVIIGWWRMNHPPIRISAPE